MERLISPHVHQSKRAQRAIMNNSIDDLPDVVLIEILCRLPCYEFVSQCKFVSKRWCTLMSSPYFSRRFLTLQIIDHKPNGTLINRSGDEFLNRMSSSSQPLRLLLQRIMNFHGLEQEPVVVSTYNDLVLCCATEEEQRDYYICNPYTMQWFPLPPPPQVVEGFTPVGFICDLPYYNYKKDDKGGHVVELNLEYECIVMRLIFPYDLTFSCKFKVFKVQIFSSKTGQWKESIASFPSAIIHYLIRVDLSFAYKEMLFWGAACEGSFVFGLDPFKINRTIISNITTADDTVDPYQCRFIELDAPQNYLCPLRCFGEYKDCLRMCGYNPCSCVLSVRDLSEEEIYGGSVKLCVENVKKDYCFLDNVLMPMDDCVQNRVLGFDPNNDDILYLQRIGDRDIFRCKISTREWSKIAEKRILDYGVHFPLVVPLWPTPLPRLQVSQPSWNPL